MQLPVFPLQGLTDQQAQQWIHHHHSNELADKSTQRFIKTIVTVVSEPMFELMVIAALLYWFIGDTTDAYTLLGFVCVLMGITIAHKHHADSCIEQLKGLVTTHCSVLRNGVLCSRPSKELVPQDLVLIQGGERVTADGVIIESINLNMDESSLTGESLPVPKNNQNNKVFTGSVVLSGKAWIQITATGPHTQWAQMGLQLNTVSAQRSPLQDKLNTFTQQCAVIGLVLTVVFTVSLLIKKTHWVDALLSGITFAMAVIPQELPVMMLVFTAMGAVKMAKQQVLVKQLNAVGILSEADVICLDKTGTLTNNQLQLVALTTDEHAMFINTNTQSIDEHFHELMEYAALASDKHSSDPTDTACSSAVSHWLANSEHEHPSLVLALHEPEKAHMSVTQRWTADGQTYVATKGAPEECLDKTDLTSQTKNQWLKHAHHMATNGLRVLAVLKGVIANEPDKPGIQYTLLGLIGLEDTIRTTTRQTIEALKKANIRPIMISGDHAQTALKIAVLAGIASAKDAQQEHAVITGDQWAQMTIEDKNKCLNSVNVFARFKPMQKLDIIETLKRQNKIVAMTGDGINDAVALKAANIGIAMGLRGTDIARESASLVLMSDDLSALVQALRIGQKIQWNIIHSLGFTIAVHIPIIVISLLPVISHNANMFHPVHIALLEMLINPACSIMFETQRTNNTVLTVHKTGKQLLSQKNILISISNGLIISALVAFTYEYLITHQYAEDASRTAAMMMLLACDIGLLLSYLNTPSTQGFKNNPAQGLMVFITVTLILLLTIQPQLATLLGFVQTQWSWWLIATVTAVVSYNGFSWLQAISPEQAD